MTAFEKWLNRFDKRYTTLVWSDKLLRWAFEAGYRAGRRSMFEKLKPETNKRKLDRTFISEPRPRIPKK